MFNPALGYVLLLNALHSAEVFGESGASFSSRTGWQPRLREDP